MELTGEQSDGDRCTRDPFAKVGRREKSFEADVGDRQDRVIDTDTNTGEQSNRARISHSFDGVDHTPEDTTGAEKNHSDSEDTHRRLSERSNDQGDSRMILSQLNHSDRLEDIDPLKHQRHRADLRREQCLSSVIFQTDDSIANRIQYIQDIDPEAIAGYRKKNDKHRPEEDRLH